MLDFYTYERIRNTDSRGNGKLSIGIGGHVNTEDATLRGAIAREILEEVKLSDSDTRYLESVVSTGIVWILF